jgi:putative PIN family toxin of toxin-antitoxin system
MTTERRVVFGTGVVVSAAILPRSIPRQAFDAASLHDRLLVSEATIAELDEVLRRPKLQRYLSEAQRLEFLAAYVAAAKTVSIIRRFSACRDPSDDKFLELAAGGHGEIIVSSDPDLLTLHPFHRDFEGAGGVAIDILTPRDFLDRLRQDAAS